MRTPSPDPDRTVLILPGGNLVDAIRCPTCATVSAPTHSLQVYCDRRCRQTAYYRRSQRR